MRNQVYFTNYITTLTKTRCYCQRDRYIDQQNRVEYQEIIQINTANSYFTKVQKYFSAGRIVLSKNGAGATAYL